MSPTSPSQVKSGKIAANGRLNKSSPTGPGKITAEPAPVLQVKSKGHLPSEFNHIELNLRDIDQLFNTIDPSPFQERDLDRNAEDFILSWAHEFRLDEPMDLIVHLKKLPEGKNAKHLVEESIHHYFTYRARLNHMEFRRLMKQGRLSLVVGVSFLGLCLLTTQLLMSNRHGIVPDFIQQGLTIAGWVAMWRPMEIYLYDWWPLRQRGKIFNKLSHMPVEIRKGIDPDLELLPAS
jgi:hypothetical protein